MNHRYSHQQIFLLLMNLLYLASTRTFQFQYSTYHIIELIWEANTQFANNVFHSVYTHMANQIANHLFHVQSIIFPRSHCRKCNYKIFWYENIPIISWFFLRGRCSKCKENISLIYPILELTTGLLFLLNNFALNSRLDIGSQFIPTFFGFKPQYLLLGSMSCLSLEKLLRKYLPVPIKLSFKNLFE